MVPDYLGVTAIINLGFQSSLSNEPFNITNQALTIYNCSAGERYYPYQEHCPDSISKHPDQVPLIPLIKHMINSPLKEIYTNRLCFLIDRIVGYSFLNWLSLAVRIASGPTVRVDGVTSTSSAVEHQLLAGMYLTSYR